MTIQEIALELFFVLNKEDILKDKYIFDVMYTISYDALAEELWIVKK